jgi:O-antigen/teichoic acid export membrane protein
MIKQVAIGWFSKAAAIIFTLVNTKLLIGLLGVDDYATYASVVSLSPWVALINIGLPNAIQGLIGEARATNVDARKLKSTAIALGMILLLLSIPGALGFSWVLKEFIFSNVTKVEQKTIFFMLVLVGMVAVSQVFIQIQLSEHRKLWSNLVPGVTAALQFGLLETLVHLNVEGFYDLGPASLLANIGIFAISLINCQMLPRLDIGIVNKILRRCRGYLIFAALSSATLSIDYMVLTKVASGNEISTYNIIGKVFAVVLTVHSVILTNSWSSMCEYFHSGSGALAKKLMNNIVTSGLVLGLLVSVGIAIFSGLIAEFLSDQRISELPIAMVLIWAVYICIRIWSDSFAMGLMSCNAMKELNSYLPLQAIMSVIFQIVFGKYFGAYGVIIGVLLSFLSTAAWLLPLMFFRRINALSN